jgi:hypothetical protein
MTSTFWSSRRGVCRRLCSSMLMFVFVTIGVVFALRSLVLL